jgi:hypothetical protein
MRVLYRLPGPKHAADFVSIVWVPWGVGWGGVGGGGGAILGSDGGLTAATLEAFGDAGDVAGGYGLSPAVDTLVATLRCGGGDSDK